MAVNIFASNSLGGDAGTGAQAAGSEAGGGGGVIEIGTITMHYTIDPNLTVKNSVILYIAQASQIYGGDYDGEILFNLPGGMVLGTEAGESGETFFDVPSGCFVSFKLNDGDSFNAYTFQNEGGSDNVDLARVDGENIIRLSSGTSGDVYVTIMQAE